MLKKIAILFAAALIIIACKQSTDPNPDAEVQAVAAALRVASALSTDQLQYQPGDSVSLQLKNTTDRTIGQNLCTVAIEKKDGDDWTSMPSLRICTAALFSLEPDQQASDVYLLDENQQAGTFRFMLKIYLPSSNANSPIYSNPFTVE